MSFQLDMTFPHNYEILHPVDKPSMPGTAKVIYYPGAAEDGTWDGLTIKVRPRTSQPWIGVFAFGGLYGGGPTGVFALPASR